MLMRIGLNQYLIDIDKATSHFIDNKKTTFEAYVKQKMESKEAMSNFFLSFKFTLYLELEKEILNIDELSDDEIITSSILMN